MSMATDCYYEFVSLTLFSTSIGYAYLSKSISLFKQIDKLKRGHGRGPGLGRAGPAAACIDKLI